MAFDVGAWIDARIRNVLGSDEFKQSLKLAISEVIADENLALRTDVQDAFGSVDAAVKGITASVTSVSTAFANLPDAIIKGVLGGLHLPFPFGSPGQ